MVIVDYGNFQGNSSQLMKKKKAKEKRLIHEEEVLIDKIYLLTDDEKRGWFRFWTMESDERWYGSWWTSLDYIMSRKKIVDFIFSDHIKSNFSGNGLKCVRIYFSDDSFNELNYFSSL